MVQDDNAVGEHRTHPDPAGDDAADDAWYELPGPYRIETPCGKRVLGFISPAHADRWLEAEGKAQYTLNLVPTAALWCTPDTDASTPEDLAAEALLPLFRELHAVYVRLGEMESLFRARRAVQGNLCSAAAEDNEGGGP